MAKKLKIAHIAWEVEPFTKNGGLANVLRSLPSAHRDLGYEVVVITPYYKGVTQHAGELEVIAENVEIQIHEDTTHTATFLKGLNDGVPVYFISNNTFFGEHIGLYGAPNQNARFFFFDIAALTLLKHIGFKADILHCHDWHSGLIPYFLKNRYKKDTFFEYTATLFTIHNLVFQLGHNWWSIPEASRDDGRSALPHFNDAEAVERINFAKRAILHADAINAVSETYRDEILTPEFGQELHRILKNREHIVFGIVNGINYEDYNPLTDPGLQTHYSDKSVNRKKDNKEYLQKYYKLEKNADIPLMCMTSRITEQKGFKLFIQIARTLLRLDTQIIVMGDGDSAISEELKKVEVEFPKRFIHTPMDHKMETSLYAGADMFLLPSRFEPCGLNQMIALRYGCIPIVHHIGGLADTIIDFDTEKGVGNGFTFKRYDAAHFLVAIIRALETYKHKEQWKELVTHSLQEANSWLIPAHKYIDLYKKAIRLKKRYDHVD